MFLRFCSGKKTAEKNDGFAAGLVFIGFEDASGDWLKTKNFEKSRSDTGGLDLFRITAAGHVEDVEDAGGDGGVGAIVILNNFEEG